MLRVVREAEAPRPSHKLSTSAALPSVAANRGTDPAKLSRLMRGELDWLVLKALEKDRSRRYDTANGLARDIQRYLADEVVEARPPTAGYRVRKWVRRHRAAVGVAFAFGVLMVTAVVMSGLFAVRAERERQRALEAAVRAERHAAEAARQTEASEAARREADDQRRTAERTAAYLAVDVELAHPDRDKAPGLLRLAKRYAALPPELTDLRQFLLSCVLRLGQEYAPLLPPIRFADGSGPGETVVSPDGSTILCFRGQPARLWDVRTGGERQLRQAGETVVTAGWLPDGRTVYTDSTDGAVRLWEPATGALRAVTPARPERHQFVGPAPRDLNLRTTEKRPVPCQVTATRILTLGWRVGPRSAEDRYFPTLTRARPPAELWDAAGGRLIRRLELPPGPTPDLRFAGHRWLVAPDGPSAVRVYSADDGRPVARLRLAAPDMESAPHIYANPSGSELAVVTFHKAGDRAETTLERWDTATWRPAGPVVAGLKGMARAYGYLSDDTFVEFEDGYSKSGYRLIARGSSTLSARVAAAMHPEVLAPDLYAVGNGQVAELATGRRLPMPAGRRFHPDLARGAADGRYRVSDYNQVVDLRVDRTIPAHFANPSTPHLAGVGFVAISPQADIRLVPISPPLVEPAALELWVKVAVRGDLSATGEFVKWDEPTWERHWRQLAVHPPATAFPFPGHLARNPLHWLDREYWEGTVGDGKRLTQERRRRAEALGDAAEAAGDAAEAARWRRGVRKQPPEVAPMPRPVVQ